VQKRRVGLTAPLQEALLPKRILCAFLHIGEARLDHVLRSFYFTYDCVIVAGCVLWIDDVATFVENLASNLSSPFFEPSQRDNVEQEAHH
jgi:hypothetical protein